MIISNLLNQDVVKSIVSLLLRLLILNFSMANMVPLILSFAGFKVELKYLCDHEFSNSLWKSTFFTGQNHFQHISMKFFHHYEDSFWGFKHTLQIYNPRVV